MANLLPEAETAGGKEFRDELTRYATHKQNWIIGILNAPHHDTKGENGTEVFALKKESHRIAKAGAGKKGARSD